MKRKIIILFALLLFVSGLFLYRYLLTPAYNSDHAVPADAMFLFYAKNNEALLHTIMEKNPLWEGLCGLALNTASLNYLLRLDSLLHADDANKKIIAGKRSSLSLHYRSKDSLVPLLVMELKGLHEKRNVERMIRQAGGKGGLTPSHQHKKTECYRVDISGGRYYFTVRGAVFMASPSMGLLHEAIENLENDGRFGLWRNKRFVDASLLWGRNVDANLYCSYPHLVPLIAAQQGEKHFSMWKNAALFANWSAMDVSIRDDVWQFNGYTSATDTSFLMLFNRQESVETKVAGVLPYHTGYFLSLGFSDVGLFMDNMAKSSGKNTDYEDRLSRFNQKYKCNLHNDFSKIAGGEICFAWIDRAPVVAIRICNREQAADLIRLFASGDSEEQKLDTDQLVSMLFGNAFFTVKSNYWTFHKEYLLIAEDKHTLQQIVGNNGKTLVGNPKYGGISEYMDNKANITFYCNSEGASRLFQKDKSRFEAFDGFSLQFSNAEGLFYTGSVLKKNTDHESHYIPVSDSLSANARPEDTQEIEEEMPTLEISEEKESEMIPEKEVITVPKQTDGRIVLEGKVTMEPSPVYNHRSQSINFILFDDQKNVYLVDKEKGILWKKNLPEQPVSKAYAVDYYANGKIQYIFNSPNYIYAVDVLGNDLKGYPIKLETKAQNPIAVFDFYNNKNYTLFFVNEKGGVEGRDKTGKKLNGWNTPVVTGKISAPVQYCAKDNNRYIIVAFDEGSVMMYNPQGGVKMTIKSSFVHNAGSGFYINKTNKKGIMLTTDRAGNLVYIPEKGAVQTTAFPAVSDKHYFLYEDLTNNNRCDFIYLDKNSLKVYDRFQNIILSHTFSHAPKNKPLFFTTDSGSYLTVYAEQEQKVYLFNKDGLITSYPATTAASVSLVRGGGKPVVVAGNDKEIVFYEIK